MVMPPGVATPLSGAGSHRHRRPVTSAEKQYVCDYPGCGRNYFQKCSLQFHQTQKHGRKKLCDRKRKGEGGLNDMVHTEMMKVVMRAGETNDYKQQLTDAIVSLSHTSPRQQGIERQNIVPPGSLAYKDELNERKSTNTTEEYRQQLDDAMVSLSQTSPRQGGGFRDDLVEKTGNDTPIYKQQLNEALQSLSQASPRQRTEGSAFIDTSNEKPSDYRPSVDYRSPQPTGTVYDMSGGGGAGYSQALGEEQPRSLTLYSRHPDLSPGYNSQPPSSGGISNTYNQLHQPTGEVDFPMPQSLTVNTSMDRGGQPPQEPETNSTYSIPHNSTSHYRQSSREFSPQNASGYRQAMGGAVFPPSSTGTDYLGSPN